ncbi:hypothetical protein I4U23_009245 [Adineta vaga]|nr:hypothetical protein I4U23_009245 [Adineta vaga]
MSDQLYSTKPQKFENNAIVCIPDDIHSLKAIVIYSTSRSTSIILKSIDGNVIDRLNPRAYLYIHFPISSLLFDEQKCFQIELESSIQSGRIQFIYRSIDINDNAIIRRIPSSLIDPCTTRRVRCKNGGQCQVLSDGETKCICPDHVTGNNCEYVGIRCANQICINQALCSRDNRSCLCQLGSQGRDCSIRCGESYIQPNISTDRIINGETAVKNSWPYIVFIQISERGWCGGSLIDAWNVLTAAHCTHGRNIEEFTLWFGVHKLDEREYEMNLGIVEKRFVRYIFNHPDYKIYPIKTYKHDLAIIRLSQSVQETVYIRYVCILPHLNPFQDVQLNDQVEIIGWGYINRMLSDGTFIRQTNELQQATIRILPDYDCSEYRRDDLILFQSKLMICAGSNDFKTDSCQGDSGGPLLMQYNNRWLQWV